MSGSNHVDRTYRRPQRYDDDREYPESVGGRSFSSLQTSPRATAHHTRSSAWELPQHGPPSGHQHAGYGTARLNPSSPVLSSSVMRSDHTDGERRDLLGLTVLHEPEGTPIADLVFVHGVGGGSTRTWTYEERSETCWPLRWLPAEEPFSSARIHSYGYTSQLSASEPEQLLDVAEFAKDLLAKLRFGTGRAGRSLNVGAAPLIFIAHSLGGLVTKKAYLLATANPGSTYGPIGQATAAFVFLSTPHRNVHDRHVVDSILAACVAGWEPGSHASIVRQQGAELQHINEKFRDCAPYLDIYSFYERYAKSGSLTHDEDLYLPHNVTTFDHPSETAIPLDVGHTRITKFESSRESNYSSVRGALQHLVTKFRPQRKASFPDDTRSQTEEVEKMLRGSDAPEDDLFFFSDKRVQGSCEWVLSPPAMQAFLESNGQYPELLWCHGAPGSGKSVTASFIIDHLMEESKACAYYYFRSGQRIKNSLGQFLTSVAVQLSRLIPEYRRKLCTVAGDRLDIGKTGHKLLWKKLFVWALLRCSPAEPFYIVVDGLDELGQAQELLERMFIDLGEASIPLRLLLVSRPTLEIEAAIERLSGRMQVRRLRLESNVDDLQMYVRWEMAVMPGEDSFKERTLQAVLAKANGNFLWAHLVVREILACQTELQVENALRQVPKELEPLYERMDTRLADMFRSRPQDRELGHQIIMWAACARRPLHVDELRGALEHDFPRIIDMAQTVQRLCGEFVHVDRKGRVSMMHASAREYLMSNARLNYYVNGLAANHVLFCNCMQILTVGRPSLEGISQSALVFQAYAASSWPVHLTETVGYEDQASLSLLTDFFGRAVILDWMSMLASENNLRALVEGSKSLATFLKISDKMDKPRSPLLHRLGDKEDLHMWSQDLVRIVGKFGPQIAGHPETIYSLLPALCPRDSIMHKQFSLDRPGAVAHDHAQLIVRGRMSSTWDDSFAKFAVNSDSSPHMIMSLDRYFAILTKGDGVVHLYYAATCEVARRLKHGDLVSVCCIDHARGRIATCSFRKTLVWDVESGRLLFSIENPSRTKIKAITFHHARGDHILTLSDDGAVRSCSLDAVLPKWISYPVALDSNITHVHQVNAPHNAQFSPDGSYLAVSYRGADPAVFFTGQHRPQFVKHCDYRSRRSSAPMQSHTAHQHVLAFAWNPVTGHLLGTYEDGMVFKWHPREDGWSLYEVKSAGIKCSADGKLFVTGSGDGTLRIWDFEHFTPIYQLRYPNRIQDLDLSRTEARIYDVREQYCNIWEPSSLLRAMETDELASDSQSSKSSDQPSLFSETIQEDFEPVTAFATRYPPVTYALGNDAGQITISDYDGRRLMLIEDSSLSVERLAWHENSDRLASVDLGREIRVRQLDTVLRDEAPESEADVLCSFSELDEVLQVLFDTTGDLLLVTNPDAVKIYRVSLEAPCEVLPAVRASVWTLHPHDARYALGFSAAQVQLMLWDEPMQSISLMYDLLDREEPQSGRPSLMLPNPRRPSQAYPASPSEIDQSVHRVLVSPQGGMALVDIYGATKQTRRRSQCLLLDTKLLMPQQIVDSVPASLIPLELSEALYIPLGFIDTESIAQDTRRRSLAEHNRAEFRRRNGLSTLAFVDNDFWVCTMDIGCDRQSTEILKHFFLPRDWQNAEWLDMATVTPAGHFPCPRNGDIAVVSNGFADQLGG